MSSLDSQFLCMGTMFTNDIAKRYFTKGEMTDKQTVFWTRTFIILVVAVTYGFSLLDPRSVFNLGVWCFSGFASLFPLIFAALYWRGLTKFGAYACIVAAAGTWAYLFVQALGEKNLGEYLLQIPIGGVTYDLMPVTGMILASTIALIVGSLVSPKLPEETVRKFFPSKSA